jgi:rubredoxin
MWYGEIERGEEAPTGKDAAMLTVKFKCPVCGESVVEEIMGDVWQSAPIQAIDEEVFECEYGPEVETNGGVVDRYQCAHCGYVLKGIDDEPLDNADSLFSWLEERKMMEEAGE